MAGTFPAHPSTGVATLPPGSPTCRRSHPTPRAALTPRPSMNLLNFVPEIEPSCSDEELPLVSATGSSIAVLAADEDEDDDFVFDDDDDDEEEDDEDDEDEDIDTDDEDADDEDAEEEEDEDETDNPNLTMEQLAEKLQNMGYTPADFLSIYIGKGLKTRDPTRQTHEFLMTLNDKIDDIIEGRVTLSDRDQRTYAQVASSN